METIFDIGEVVWAKITGYPWWPGAVTLYLLRLIKFIIQISLLTKPTSSNSSEKTHGTILFYSYQ